MLRGLYTAATGMIHQSRRLDTISNNLANVNTPGFKRDQVVNRAFEDELLLRVGGEQVPGGKAIGYINHGVYVDRVVISFEQGNMENTNLNTDIALKGEGFFVIATDQGERYTRDGGFAIDSLGRLVTTEGYPVMGYNGEIYVYSDEFQVDTMGNVTLDGVFVDQLVAVNFQNPQALEKVRDNYYLNTTEENEMIPFEGEYAQGFIERSNVEAVREMVDMITATRNYESNQRILRMIDETLGKTVNEVGRV